MQTRPNLQLGTYTASFELHVTDNNNIAIYLPQFGTATPLVDLNLRAAALYGRPGSRIAGSANLDMCLYDGYNSNSQRFELTARDDIDPPGRPAGMFSVMHETGSGAANERIDYTVSIDYGGQPITLRNGEKVTLTNIPNTAFRAVRLPNIPFPVVCTPTPMTLVTPAFNQMDKRAGQYRGNLRLVFTPSTASAP